MSASGCLPPGVSIVRTYPTLYHSKDYSVWYEATQTTNGFSGASWMLYIMPFMEYKDIADKWDFSHSVLVNKALAQRDIKAFYCPSRRSAMRNGDEENMFQHWTSGGTDYGGCVGRTDFWVNTLGPSGDHMLCGAQWTILNGSPDDPATNRVVNGQVGVFYPNSHTTLNQITDGTSHTIMVGELQRLHNSGSVPPGQNPTYYGPSMTSNDGWAVGGASCLFDCNTSGGFDQGQPGGLNNAFFESAGSQHAGGANFAAVDSSVHFISETVDQFTLGLLASMADGGIVDPTITNPNNPNGKPKVVQFP